MLAQPGRERASGALASGMIPLGLVLAAIVASRIVMAAATDFPINDGALFYEFVRATSATFPSLPATIDFNGFSLPFAYPPLSFWVGALLTRMGFDALGVVHVVPILLNIVYLLLIAGLLLRSGWSRLFVALMLLFLCTRLASFAWLTAGGGLSRGFGSIFFVLALLAVGLPKPRQRFDVPHPRMILAGAMVGGAVLSHLEWGSLAAASVVLARTFGARSLKQFIIDSLLAGLTAILIVTPWFLTIYSTHGIEPFLRASASSAWHVSKSVLKTVELVRSGIANPFIAVGFVVLLVRRDYFWIAFVLLCTFVTPRQSPTPVALSMSIFAAQGVLTSWEILRQSIRRNGVALAAVAGVLTLIIAVNAYRDFTRSNALYRPLRPELREAMRWVAQNHAGAQFAVINARPWASDSSAEWLPVLGRVTNTTTVQGREWLPSPIFVQSEALADEAKESETCADLTSRFGRFGRPEFVWTEMMPECFAPPRYELVYRNERVSIFKIRRT